MVQEFDVFLKEGTLEAFGMKVDVFEDLVQVLLVF